MPSLPTNSEESIWSKLGLPPPVHLDESLAPPVDRELLLKLERRELPERTARAVFRLIDSFASWNDAHADVVVSEYHRTRPK